MSVILIADDDKTFRMSLVEGLKAHNPDWTVLTAENGKQALSVLESQSVDLVVSDLKMPLMNGFDLMEEVKRQDAQIPVIIVTAFGTPEIEKHVIQHGASQYLEKPLDFNLLMERIEAHLPPKTARAKENPLLSLLEMARLKKKTCTIAIRSGEKSGFVYFKNGELVHAETDGSEGEQAVLNMISWPDLRSVAVEKMDKSERSVHPSFFSVLVDILRYKSDKSGYWHSPDANAIEPETAGTTEPPPAAEPASPVRAATPTAARRETASAGSGPSEKTSPAPSVQPPPNHASAGLSSSGPINMGTPSPAQQPALNVARLERAVKTLKEMLGPALVATDICGDDGLSLVSFNSQSKAAALFAQMIPTLHRILSAAELPGLGRYCILELVDRKMVVIIPLGSLQWVMLVDTAKTQLGFLLNIALPKCVGMFEETLAK